LNNSNDKSIFNLINDAFGYNISNIQYFTSAFTHKITSDDNYERLEILGDSVLQLTVTELLFLKYPEYTEGEITVVRQKLVNSKSLKKLFLSLKLEDLFKKMNPKFTEGNVYSDIFESLVGAMYLDSNYETIRDIVHNIFMPLLSDKLADKDSKTLLQEYMHSKKLRLPSYTTSVIKNDKYNYLVSCKLLDLNMKESIQSNKVKSAEQKLARALLNKLNEKN
jgi:ribonuclease-3